jgi:hypothetical protein
VALARGRDAARVLANAGRIRLKTGTADRLFQGRDDLLLCPTGERSLDVLEGAIVILHGAAARLSVEVTVEGSHAPTLSRRLGPAGEAASEKIRRRMV